MLSFACRTIKRSSGLICVRSEKYFSGRSGVVLIALVWVYANCAMIPGYLGLIGTWGYNCMSGTRVRSIHVYLKSLNYVLLEDHR